MLDEVAPPETLAAILVETERIGFGMASEPLTGALLRALAASRPGGRLLELGTGTRPTPSVAAPHKIAINE